MDGCCWKRKTIRFPVQARWASGRSRMRSHGSTTSPSAPPIWTTLRSSSVGRGSEGKSDMTRHHIIASTVIALLLLLDAVAPLTPAVLAMDGNDGLQDDRLYGQVVDDNETPVGGVEMTLE